MTELLAIPRWEAAMTTLQSYNPPRLTPITCCDTFTRGHKAPLMWKVAIYGSLLLQIPCHSGSYRRALALQACAIRGSLLPGDESLDTKGQTEQLSQLG